MFHVCVKETIYSAFPGYFFIKCFLKSTQQNMDKPVPSTSTNASHFHCLECTFAMDCDAFVFTDYNLSLEKHKFTCMLSTSPDAA